MGNVVENFAAELSMVRELSLNGTQSGSPLVLRGKSLFSYQPVLDQVSQKTNVWRLASGNAFHSRHYQGSISGVYSHDTAILILLESLIGLFSTQADTPSVGLTTYSFRPQRLDARKSLAIGLAYDPTTPSNPLNAIFTGVVIDQISFSIRARELIKWKVDFKAVDMQQGAMLSASSNAFGILRGLDANATLNGVSLDKSYELNCSFAARVVATQFDSAKKATKMQQTSGFSFTGEVAEYFNSDTIPAAVRNQSENALQIDVLFPNASQKLSVIWPRVIFRGGTPEGVSASDLTCRASFEGLNDDALADANQPKLLVVL